MGRFSWTTWTGPNITTGVLVRERQREFLPQRECDDEVGVGLMWPEVKECWRRNRFSLRASRRRMDGPVDSWFQPRETGFGPLSSRTIRK